MKNLILLLVFMFISCSINASPISKLRNKSKDVCYVKTADKVYFGQDIRKGILHTKIISADGNINTVDNEKITGIMHNNKIYEMLPVICENGDTLCHALLEYVTERSGLKLYKYCCHQQTDPRYGYFVFKDNKLYLRVNMINYTSVFPFFGVSWTLQ